MRFLGPLLFLFAFGLRLIAIGWGLPNDLHNQSYHPDEQVIWQVSQRIKPTELDFSPDFYNYGTLYLTTMRIASDVVAGYGGGAVTTGVSPEVAAKSYWDYMARCHLAGRVLSALFGAGLALIVYLIGKRVMSEFGAVIAGLTSAIAPGLVVHSRFQTVDMLATFLFAVSVYFSVRLLDGAAEWDKAALKLVGLAGLFAGLSAGTKYTGILALGSVIGACYLCQRPKPLRAIALSSALAALGFFVATPGALFDRAAFIRDFTYELGHTASGHGLVFEGYGSGFAVHLGNLATTLTPLVLVLAIIGLCLALYKRQRWAIVTAISCLLVYIAIGRAEVLFLRYVFPLTVALCLGLGWLAHSAQTVGGRWRFAVAGVMLVLGNGLSVAWQWTSAMLLDPRDVMVRYLKDQGQGKSVGLVSDPWFYSPPFFPDSTINRGLFKFQQEEMQKTANPRVFRYVPEIPDERYDWDTRLLDAKPDFVAFSSFEAGDPARLARLSNLRPEVALLVSRFNAFHDRLESEYEIVGSSGDMRRRYAIDALTPHDMMYVRPSLYLWKRK